MAQSTIGKQPLVKMLGLGGVAALVLVVGCESAPTPTASPTPATGVHPGKLTVLLPELGNERFDFVSRSNSAGTGAYIKLLHGTLLTPDQNVHALPGIASGWSLAPDFRTWTFTIRQGLKFHDGSDITTDDVLWTFQHALGPQATAYTVFGPAVRLVPQFENLEMVGPDTIRYTTKSAIEPLNGLLGYILGIRGGAELLGVMPKRNTLGDGPEASAYDLKPVGAGPMKVASHNKGLSMEFQRFEDFYLQPKYGFPEDRRVNFQALDLVIAPEEATRVAAVAAGQADIALASLQSRRVAEQRGGRLIFAKEGQVLDVRLLGCWGEPVYPCHDQRVRQALAYAINKELLRDQLWGAEAFEVKGWNIATPSTIGYTPELDPWPFDPDRARQLLAAAGYPGGRGFGKLIVNTYTGSALPFLAESAQATADTWKRELGLDVEVRVADQAVVNRREANDELRGQVLWRDQSTRVEAASSFLESHYGNPGRGPRRLQDDPEVYRIVREALGVLDEDRKAENARKLFPFLRDLAYQPGIGYVNILWAVGPRVVTWQPEPLSGTVGALHTVVLRRD